MKSMKNKFFNILITCIFLVVVSCVSKFEKDQRIVQQDYTKKTAILTKSRIDSLVETLSNSCKNQDDVNKNTFENLKSKYNEISALVLQHIDGKVIKTLPEEFDTSEINKTYLNKEMIKLFRKNKNIQILPNILENKNKYLCLLIPLNDKNQNLTNIISVFLDRRCQNRTTLHMVLNFNSRFREDKMVDNINKKYSEKSKKEINRCILAFYFTKLYCKRYIN